MNHLNFFFTFSGLLGSTQIKYYDIIVMILLFLVPPRIVPFNFDEPIYSGQSAQITCLVSEGDAPMNITWWFRKSDKSELVPLITNGISVNKMGSKLSMLFIESTSSFFAGIYACVVENRAGSSKYTSTLNVHGKTILCSTQIGLYLRFLLRNEYLKHIVDFSIFSGVYYKIIVYCCWLCYSYSTALLLRA